VRDNIALGPARCDRGRDRGRPRAPPARIDFITAFPSGYDTQVGRARHARWRAASRQTHRGGAAPRCSRDAPVILLDEATASLDFRIRAGRVQLANRAICARGRTTIVIAHRLHTVVDADRIFVIEGWRGRRNPAATTSCCAKGRALRVVILPPAAAQTRRPPRPDVA